MNLDLNRAEDRRSGSRFGLNALKRLIRPLRILGSALHPGRCCRDEPTLHSPAMSIPMIGGPRVEVGGAPLLVGGNVNAVNAMGGATRFLQVG